MDHAQRPGSWIEYDVVVHRDVPVPMRDGVRLATDVHLPKGDGPFPAILVKTPYNFNKMGWFFKKTLSAIKPQLEAAGIPETEPGLYDTRDLNAIRSWAKELAQKVQS